MQADDLLMFFFVYPILAFIYYRILRGYHNQFDKHGYLITLYISDKGG